MVKENIALLAVRCFSLLTNDLYRDIRNLFPIKKIKLFKHQSFVFFYRTGT